MKTWRLGELAILDHRLIRPPLRGRMVRIEILDPQLPGADAARMARLFPGERLYGAVDLVSDTGWFASASSLHPINDPDQHQTRETTQEIPA